MGEKKNRIGFILASICTGSAQNMWSALIREASHSDAAFYIFPGGKLNAEPDSEYLRNSIYRLVNAQNLDGLISWGSSLGGAVSVEELTQFHTAFTSLPFVTIAHKITGHPCVGFDAYGGMADLVRHFLTVHKSRRIAFLRGPLTHMSASERYRAFCDIMAQNSCPMENSPLVSDPFSWSDGEAAVRQLYEERGLVPGRDYEVLIGASDMMVLAASRYLQRAGYRAPEDYACAGFNDSIESRILGSTTVHMPYNRLGLTAFAMMRGVLGSGFGIPAGTVPMKDVTLPTHVVLRESCGCPDFALAQYDKGIADDVPVSVTKSSSQKDIVRSLAALFHSDSTTTNAVIEPLVGAVVQRDEPLLFSLLERILSRFFEQNGDVRLVHAAYRQLKASSCVDAGWLTGQEPRFLLVMSRIQDRTRQLSQYNERRFTEQVNSLKCGLLTARSRDALCGILADHLPQLGITRAALVLTDKDDVSTFIGGFTPGKRYAVQKEFPADLLLPREIAGFDTGVFLVQPLFTERQPLGYFVCSVPQQYTGAVYEDLRSAISSALAGIFMFEENSAAKQRAEQAEAAKNSFFANVGSDLSEPLVEVARRIEQMQTVISAVSRENDILSGQMVFLKNQIAEQLDKTNLVIDLTKLQTNELAFKKRLFHIEETLGLPAAAAGFPLLYGDPDRIAQAAGILCDVCGVDRTELHASESEDGLVITVQGSGPLHDSVWTQNNMQVVQHIFLRSGASLRRTGTGCSITYPWPTFACGTAARGATQYEWNADAAQPADWVAVYGRRNDAEFSECAFLCRTQADNEALAAVRDFEELFERQMAGAVQRPAFFIGGDFAVLPDWAAKFTVRRLESMSEFDAAVRESEPALVVLSGSDDQTVRAVQTVRNNPTTVMCPVFVLPERLEEEPAADLFHIPRVILCNRCIAYSKEFAARMRSILIGGGILPPDTGAVVKRAVVYLNMNYAAQIMRWKLADHVHVNEDYLTRIFHKELGLSPWEYLNRYRIYRAGLLLLHTNDTMYDIAEKTGFQDPAYFSRVFRKIMGITPAKYKQSASGGTYTSEKYK